MVIYLENVYAIMVTMMMVKIVYANNVLLFGILVFLYLLLSTICSYIGG